MSTKRKKTNTINLTNESNAGMDVNNSFETNRKKTKKVSNVNINVFNSLETNRQRKLKKSRQNNLNEFRQKLIKTGVNPHLINENIPVIRHMSLIDFLYCTTRLFKLIENDTKDYKRIDDIFMKKMFHAHTDTNDEASWESFNNTRKFMNGLSARLGDFHEEVAGKLTGYRTLPVGHWSGVDVMNDEKTEFYEWKNKYGISSETLKTVYFKFKRILDKFPRAICVLVYVNIPSDVKRRPEPILRTQTGKIVIDLTEEKYKGRIFIVSGKEAYAHMSKDNSFYEKLISSTSYVFKHPRLEDLISTAKTLMEED